MNTDSGQSCFFLFCCCHSIILKSNFFSGICHAAKSRSSVKMNFCLPFSSNGKKKLLYKRRHSRLLINKVTVFYVARLTGGRHYSENVLMSNRDMLVLLTPTPPKKKNKKSYSETSTFLPGSNKPVFKEKILVLNSLTQCFHRKCSLATCDSCSMATSANLFF